MEEEQDENDEQKIISRKRIQRSIDVFKNALKKLNTPKMWNYYLDHVIEIYNNSQFKSILPKFTSEVLDEAMKGY